MNVSSSVPMISLHVPSSSTIKTAQKLPTFQSKINQSTSNTQSNSTSITTTKNVNQIIPSAVSFNQKKAITNKIKPSIVPFIKERASEPSSPTNSEHHAKSSVLNSKLSDNFQSIWDLDEINNFTREIFSKS